MFVLSGCFLLENITQATIRCISLFYIFGKEMLRGISLVWHVFLVDIIENIVSMPYLPIEIRIWGYPWNEMLHWWWVDELWQFPRRSFHGWVINDYTWLYFMTGLYIYIHTYIHICIYICIYPSFMYHTIQMHISRKCKTQSFSCPL